jgi:hypothetical protein
MWWINQEGIDSYSMLWLLLLIFHSTWKLKLWDLVTGLKFWMNLIKSCSPCKTKCDRKSLRWLDLYFCFWKHLIRIMFTTYLPSCWIFISNIYELLKIIRPMVQNWLCFWIWCESSNSTIYGLFWSIESYFPSMCNYYWCA